MSASQTIESTDVEENSAAEPSFIVIDDDSEPEAVRAQLLHQSPEGSVLKLNGSANGFHDNKNDMEIVRSPATTAGDVLMAGDVLPNETQTTIQLIPGDEQHEQKAKSATSKPKTKEDSPPPQLPPRPPPMPTVRLQFFIEDPEEYEVDILAKAKATGQRLPTPPAYKDSSDSEDDDEPPEQPILPVPSVIEGQDTSLVPKKRRKRQNKDYDLDDPFIDDEDLAIDERTHIAQTIQKGFYVSNGDVDLVAQSSPPPAGKRGPGRPPKRTAGPVSATLVAQVLLNNPLGSHLSDEITPSAIAAAIASGAGTKESPILLREESEPAAPTTNDRKRKASPKDNMDPKKKRKITEILPFHPALEKEIEELKQAIARHGFENKGKFPPDLKPILLAVSIRAIELGEFNDNYFNYLPKIFPYNRYTMLKLTKRLAYTDHIRLIHERQQVLLMQLKTLIDENLETAQTEWERSVQIWEDRKSRKKAEEKQKEAQSEVEDVAKVNPSQTDHEKDHEKEGEDGEEDKDKPPAKRYRLNETMRGYLWALVQLSNEICTLANEKNSLEGSKEVVSDQGQRKVLYQQILGVFPEGWMNTGAISREVSMMKKKMESVTIPKDEKEKTKETQ